MWWVYFEHFLGFCFGYVLFTTGGIAVRCLLFGVGMFHLCLCLGFVGAWVCCVSALFVAFVYMGFGVDFMEGVLVLCVGFVC